jgi:16S rRNA (cytidine1402-2'-O)-methyltransferase
MAGVLHIVATPIGNLGDLGDRARETLGAVDIVVAEDTRRTGRLLQAIGVRATMRSFFEGNERARVPAIVRELVDGRSVALVSDGGMPLVSDPGYRLVAACVEAGIEVRVVPGPSAVLAALVVSGLATDRFSFEGFLPRTSGERRARLAEVAHDPRTLVFFESPRRVPGMLRDLVTTMGDRRVALCRVLTKLHEEVRRGTASEVLGSLEDDPLRGEVVIVVEGDRDGAPVDMAAAVASARALVAEGARKRDAAHAVADRLGISANQVYRALLDADAS